MDTVRRDSIRNATLLRAGLDLLISAALGSFHTVRLLLAAVLGAVTPIVCAVLTVLGVLGMLVALVFEYSGAAPGFPFWTMITISAAMLAAAAAWQALVTWLAR